MKEDDKEDKEEEEGMNEEEEGINREEEMLVYLFSCLLYIFRLESCCESCLVCRLYHSCQLTPTRIRIRIWSQLTPNTCVSIVPRWYKRNFYCRSTMVQIAYVEKSSSTKSSYVKVLSFMLLFYIHRSVLHLYVDYYEVLSMVTKSTISQQLVDEICVGAKLSFLVC